ATGSRRRLAVRRLAVRRLAVRRLPNLLLRRDQPARKGQRRRGGRRDQPRRPDRRVLHVRLGHRGELQGLPRKVPLVLLRPGLGEGLRSRPLPAPRLRLTRRNDDEAGRRREQGMGRGLDLRYSGRSPEPVGHPPSPTL
ncbi:MAG: hypothetical protein AVDCRST_MAG01-01-44, partial [uncultured Rubrobacteraceae bacterium]